MINSDLRRGRARSSEAFAPAEGKGNRTHPEDEMCKVIQKNLPAWKFIVEKLSLSCYNY